MFEDPLEPGRRLKNFLGEKAFRAYNNICRVIGVIVLLLFLSEKITGIKVINYNKLIILFLVIALAPYIYMYFKEKK